MAEREAARVWDWVRVRARVLTGSLFSMGLGGGLRNTEVDCLVMEEARGLGRRENEELQLFAIAFVSPLAIELVCEQS